MNKKLPKVYVNQIDKKIENNERVYYSKEKQIKDNYQKDDTTVDVNQKLNRIFHSPRYVYKADVKIVLKDRTVQKRVIGRNGNYLITFENELIPISDILDIEFIQ